MLIVDTNIREYTEYLPVHIDESTDKGRLVVVAYNESGYNFTRVDVVDLIEWVKQNRPDLLK